MTRQLKQKRTQNLTTYWVIAAVLMLGLIALGIIEDRRRVNYEAYAKANNCVWHATGTWYGDDRDFICRR